MNIAQKFFLLFILVLLLVPPTVSSNNSPVIMVKTTKKIISAGGYHCLALSSDKTVWAWGSNGSGRLGNVDVDDMSNTPVKVNDFEGIDILRDIESIHTGTLHSLAISKESYVWAWGSNASGQLGDPDVVISAKKPVKVKGPSAVGYLYDIIAVDGGKEHSIALKKDGTVWTWGDNSFGQLGVRSVLRSKTPVQVLDESGNDLLTDIIAIAAGGYHSIALSKNGTIWAWGNNTDGQLGNFQAGQTSNLPYKVTSSTGYLENIVSISSGYSHNLALDESGNILAWGKNDWGQLGNPEFEGKSAYAVYVKSINGNEKLNNVSSISAGYSHSIALLKDGTIVAWGDNRYGRLGDGTTNTRNLPVFVKDLVGNDFLKGIVAIDAGDEHSMALYKDGTILTWGLNNNGQLGDSTGINRKIPVEVHGPSNIGLLNIGILNIPAETNEDELSDPVLLSVRDYEGGTLTITAYSSNPLIVPDELIKLNDSAKTLVTSLQPSQIFDLEVSIKPESDMYGNVDITIRVTDETDRYHEAKINFNIISINDPPIVSPIENIAIDEDSQTNSISFSVHDIDSNDLYIYGISSNTSLVPNNSDNIIINANGDPKSLILKPVKNKSGTTTITIIARDPEGLTGMTSFMLGVNQVNDPPNIFINQYIKQIVSGQNHNLALKTDGTVWAWGANNYGQLGDNTTTPKKNPVQVSGLEGNGFLTNIKAVAAGGNHSLALANDGKIFAWGENKFFQLGDSSIDKSAFPLILKDEFNKAIDNNIAIAAGGYHSLALNSDGKILAWGRNIEGQLGNGTNQSTNIPTFFDTQFKFIAIAAGSSHSMALRDDSTVWGCGDNLYGQLGNNTLISRNVLVQVKDNDGLNYLTDIIEIAAGGYHSLALMENSILWAWGNNSNGQLGNGTNSSSMLPVKVIGPNNEENLDNIIAIEAGLYHSMAILNDKTIMAWGSNEEGQLGNGDDGKDSDQYKPVQVKDPDGTSLLSNIVSIDAGQSHSIAQKADGSIWAWGFNFSYQLGDGTNQQRLYPVQVVDSQNQGFVTEIFPIELSFIENSSMPVLRFTITDVETPNNNLILSSESSNEALVPIENIQFGGSGHNRNVTISPVDDKTGNAVIKIIVSDGQDSNWVDFSINVNKFTYAPNISYIPDQEIEEDNHTSQILFTLTDPDTPVSSLIVTGSSSNQELVPDDPFHIAFSGASENRSVMLTPYESKSGKTVITIKVSDGTNETTSFFTLTVIEDNDAPTISSINDQVINEDSNEITISFTIGDIETPASELIVSAVSSNTDLVPNDSAHIAFTGSGAERNIILRPLPDKSGSTSITITVKDSLDSKTEVFKLFVQEINDMPSISDISNQEIDEDNSCIVSFVVEDIESSPDNLIVEALSSDTDIVPEDENHMIISTTGSNRSLKIIPASDGFGTLEITVKVKDEHGLSASTTFELNINPVNDPPWISKIDDLKIMENNSTDPISFTVIDDATPAGSIIVTANSSNTTLVPNNESNIKIVTSGENRIITISPADSEFGSTTITVNANDGYVSSQLSFNLEVESSNIRPVISNITDQTTNLNTAITITFSVSDAETPPDELLLSAVSLNKELIPDINIKLLGQGTNRSMVIMPYQDKYGVAEIDLTVFDGIRTASEKFKVTVNTYPVISSIQDQSTKEDTSTNPISFTVSDKETNADDLIVSAYSKDAELVPIQNFVYEGSGNFRSIIIKPGKNKYGTAEIIVKVNDGASESISSFNLEIIAQNDPPSISEIPDQTSIEDIVTDPIIFTVTDPENPNDISLLAFSSNKDIVAEQNIVFGSDGQNSTIVITPEKDMSGELIISIMAADPEGASISTSFKLTVLSASDPPIAKSGKLTAIIGIDNFGTLVGEDPENESLTYSIVKNGEKGNVEIIDPRTGQYIYTPDVSEKDEDTFLFKVNDGFYDSEPAIVYVTIKTGDWNPPEITIRGDNPSYILLNDPRGYVDPGADAYDDKDGNLNKYLSTIGIASVDTNKLGTYYILYKVNDFSGNIAQAIRTVEVVSIKGNLCGKITNIPANLVASPEKEIQIKLLDPVSQIELRSQNVNYDGSFCFENLSFNNYIVRIIAQDLVNDSPRYIKKIVDYQILIDSTEKNQNFDLQNLTPIENSVKLNVALTNHYQAPDPYSYKIIDSNNDTYLSESGLITNNFKVYIEPGYYRLIIIAKDYNIYEYSKDDDKFLDLTVESILIDENNNAYINADFYLNPIFDPNPCDIDFSHIVIEDPSKAKINGFILWFTRKNFPPDKNFKMTISTGTSNESEYEIDSNVYNGSNMLNGESYALTWTIDMPCTKVSLDTPYMGDNTYEIKFNFYMDDEIIETYNAKYIDYSSDIKDIEEERAYFFELFSKKVLYETQTQTSFYPLIGKLVNITFKDSNGNDVHETIRIPAIPTEYLLAQDKFGNNINISNQEELIAVIRYYTFGGDAVSNGASLHLKTKNGIEVYYNPYLTRDINAPKIIIPLKLNEQYDFFNDFYPLSDSKDWLTVLIREKRGISEIFQQEDLPFVVQNNGIVFIEIHHLSMIAMGEKLMSEPNSLRYSGLKQERCFIGTLQWPFQ